MVILKTISLLKSHKKDFYHYSFSMTEVEERKAKEIDNLLSTTLSG